jgi:membrane protein required for colicin V production
VTAPGTATLDLVVLGLLLLFAVAGAFSGALRQLTQLASVVAGWAAARYLAPRLAGPLLGPRPPAWERGALAAGCFLGAVFLVWLLGRAIARRVHGPGGEPGPVDRAAGALLGGLKAGLAAWVLLSALALARGPIVVGSLKLDLRGSDFGSLAARHNLLEAAAPKEAGRLERLLRAIRDPAARQRLLGADPKASRLLDDPRVKALLERPPGEDRERLEELLSDPEFGRLVDRLEPE